jgi:hypothetical protein
MLFNIQRKQLKNFTLQGEQTTLSLLGLPSGLFYLIFNQ